MNSGQWGLLICAFMVSTWAAEKAAADPGSKKPAFEIEKDVPIEMLFGRYHMVVDLGALPMGVKGTAKLQLVNRNQAKFSVDEVRLGCSCTSASLSADEINPDSSALLTVEITTKSASKSESVVNSVSLVSKNDSSKTISLALRYSIAGLMTFAGDAYVCEVNPDLERQTVKVPFLISDPVSAQDVEFEVIPDIDGVLVSLEEEKGKHFANVVFDPVFVPDESLPLTIIARDATHNLVDQMPLLLRRQRQVEITPKTLRFMKNREEHTASAILRYRPTAKEGNGESGKSEQKSGAILVEASMKDDILITETKKLGNGIYRVLLAIDSEKMQHALESDERPVVKWQIRTPSKAFKMHSEFTTQAIAEISPSK